MCGIAGGRTNALVVLMNELLVGEFVGTFNPPGYPGPVVEEFGEGLGTAIGEGFDEDRTVGVVFLFLKLAGPCVRAVQTNHESPQIVGCATAGGCEKVAQRIVGLTAILGQLLPQGMKANLLAAT